MNLGTVCGQTPILDLATGVRKHLAAKGYKERDLIRLQKIWNHFARYAGNCHFTIEIGAAFLWDAYGIEWSEFPPPMKRHQRRSVSAIRYLRDYELTGEISLHRPMKQPYVWPEQFSSVAKSFFAHMDQCGYSKDYIRGTTREVHRLLEYLSGCGVQNCKTIAVSDVMSFIREQYSHIAVSTLKITVGKIRTFLRFLYLSELTDQDLASLISPVRSFRLAQIPVVWNPDDLKLLLAAISRETSDGKRDFAIFMLAVHLGLRIGDILHLQFKNIDWEKSVIQISQIKTDELLSLPMSTEIGWALIDYIKNGRPKTDSSFIFVRHCAPFQAFCINNNFHYQMRKYAALAGITPPSPKLYGFHSIRHTFATNLLKEGTNLSLISEFLGHNGVSATPIYLKVDDEHLRICALDPDIEVCYE